MLRRAVRATLAPMTRPHPVMRAALAAAGVLLLTSCTTASLPPIDLPAPSDEARGIVVMAHGVEGRAENWPAAFERYFEQTAADRSLWQFYRLDWYEASLDRLAAPRRAYELGRRIGEELVGSGRHYEVVHLIGHSAGAHVVHGIEDVFARLDAAERPAIHATFLDPFVARSVVGLFRGVRTFGEHADFAMSYVTRDDPVPFTNSYLDHAYNIDLTQTVPEREDAPENLEHVWPIEYYRTGADPEGAGIGLSPVLTLDSTVTRSRALDSFARLAERFPPGTTTVR